MERYRTSWLKRWAGCFELGRQFSILVLLSGLVVPYAQANWFVGDSFVGPWTTTNAMRNFAHAQTIHFELWVAEDGSPEGVAVLTNNRQECTGSLVGDRATGELRFKPVQSKGCDSLAGGYFQFQRFNRKSLMLNFVPEVDQNSDATAKPYMTFYRRLPSTPPNLLALVASAKKPGQSASEGVQSLADEHSKAAAVMRTAMGSSFQQSYPESHLIGVWRGQFVDRKRSYPAELAMWSVKWGTVYSVGGLVSFGDQVCSTSVRVGDDGVRLVWSAGDTAPAQPEMNTSRSCEKFQIRGQLNISDDGNTLAVNIPSSAKAENLQSCLHEGPDYDEKRICLGSGLLTRSAPSDQFSQTIASFPWDDNAFGPEDGHWDTLRSKDVDLTSLVAFHDAKVIERAQILAQNQVDRAAAEVRRDQELSAKSAQRRRAQVAAQQQREQRTRDRLAQQSFGGPTAAQAQVQLPTLPKISGPFDGLSGSNYLNALHDANYAAVAVFDDYYVKEKLKQRRDAMGGPHWMDGILDAGTKQIRIVDTVLAVYLFAYQSKYARCLRDDAVTFEVVTVVPDTTIENLLGVEVARSYGWTDYDYFKINREFTAAFRRVGTSKPGGTSVGIMDLLLNQGDRDVRQEAMAGIKQAMNKFACDGPTMKRVEETLLVFSSR